MKIPYLDSKLCECGCGQEVRQGRRFIKDHHFRTCTGKNNYKWKEECHIISECKCGCGRLTSQGRQFISGHNRRKPKPLFTSVHPCECGCGRLVRYRFAVGHANKGKNLSQEWKDKIGDSNRGKTLDPELVKSNTEKNYKNGHYARRSKAMKENNPWSRPDVIQKSIETKTRNGFYERASKRMKENNPMARIIHPLKQELSIH